MNILLFRFYFHLLFVLFFYTGYSQNTATDSLWKIVKEAKNDTARIGAYNVLGENVYLENADSALILWGKSITLAEKNLSGNPSSLEKRTLLKYLAAALNNIGYINQNRGETEVALEYYSRSMKIDEEIGNKDGVAYSLNNFGLIYYDKGDVNKALSYFLRSLKIQEEIGDKEGISLGYNNLAAIYDNLGDIPKALEYYHKSLRIKEEIGQREGIAQGLNNLGVMYRKQEDFKKALEYYEKSLLIWVAMKNREGIADVINNIGGIYRYQGDYSKALQYYSKSMELRESIKDKDGVAGSLNNIASIYRQQKNYPLALEYFRKSLNIWKDLEDRRGIAVIYSNIGGVYFTLNRLDLAHAYADSAYYLSDKLGFPGSISESAELRYRVLKELGKYDEALKMHEKFIVMRDSIKNEQTRKSGIQQQFQYEYEKKNEADRIKHEEEIHKQKLYTYGGIVGFLLMIIVAGISIYAFRQKQKTNSIISRQKTILEEKQKEILDSIHYAKRIQDSLFPSDRYIDRNLKELNSAPLNMKGAGTGFFIFYKPKDIISGDFYYALAHKPAGLDRELLFVCTADCTGHGVPGALMSMVAISQLNESIIEKNLFHPNEILDNVRKGIISSLNPEGSLEESKDGMDCVLCVYDFNTMVMEFAAANNPVWHLRNKAITEYKADKMPVGKSGGQIKPFTLHRLPIQKNDLIYTFTDGFADQFGGAKGKKFKYKPLQELILANSSLDMPDQKHLLDRHFEDWKGNLEQIDDVCIIGIRI